MAKTKALARVSHQLPAGGIVDDVTQQINNVVVLSAHRAQTLAHATPQALVEQREKQKPAKATVKVTANAVSDVLCRALQHWGDLAVGVRDPVAHLEAHVLDHGRHDAHDAELLIEIGGRRFSVEVQEVEKDYEIE